MVNFETNNERPVSNEAGQIKCLYHICSVIWQGHFLYLESRPD